MTAPHPYYLPGLHIEDHTLEVPLFWGEADPASPRSVEAAYDKGSLSLFYRVVTAPDKVHEDLPLLVFLQGGPGGAGPRPLTVSDEGWISEAVNHFRVVLPDQRGTGRSTPVTAASFARVGAVADQARYLKAFLADSIVKDFEYLRLQAFGGVQWASLGQSYGGFLTLSYLSHFPQSLTASFTTGGIPGVPASADEVYRHTYPRVAAKTQQYYDRYPGDIEVVGQIADRLAEGDVVLPNGDAFSVEKLQSLGRGLGMKPAPERLHWLFDQAFDARGDVSDGFLLKVLGLTSAAGQELYWPLQEFIYADGSTGECAPLRWAAQREREGRAEFAPTQRPLMFTGEMAYPWMFDEDSVLRVFKPAVEVLMEETQWGAVYDAEQLRANTVPLQAAVYFDDMYVDSGIQLDTLGRVGASHAWVTNDYEHDGVHGTGVFAHLYELAQARGDVAALSRR